ncbi:MAG TPA: ACT domain-containing protein [Candidatus Peribacteraceae bacterium]|nr:ACT domain-containing protein [Candidatus Peribacteraceae bacterium]
MQSEVQLSVTMPNIPSSLAKVCDTLRAANVNIVAISCTEGSAATIIHLVVNDPETAKIVLKPFGKIISKNILSFLVKNKPGAIASIGRAFAGAEINIHNIYSTTTSKDSRVYVVVEDAEKALKALEPWKSTIMEAH